MQDWKFIIAKNITALRQNRKMTQAELADKLNYSDKAVSKWERGESVPDVLVLKSIADLFGVSLDYLLEETHTTLPQPAETSGSMRLRTVVTLLSIVTVWFAATLSFVFMDIFFSSVAGSWLAFVFAVPASMTVWLVFNSIWFNSRRNYLIISLLGWSLIAAISLMVMVLGGRAWQLFILGAPGQVAIIIWSRMHRGKSCK